MGPRNRWWLALSVGVFLVGFIASYFVQPCGNPWPDVRWQDLVMFLGLLSLSLVAISLVNSKAVELKEDEDGRYKTLGFDKEWTQDPIVARRHRVYGKINTAEALFARDLAPVSFDISPHQDVASVHEYRGLLHWHRDVTEKLLSIFLLLVFTTFLARAFGFLADFLGGNSHRLDLIGGDVDLAIKVVGFALVIDGVILIGAMTDAPGIRRTLDAVIVVLAGVVVLAAHAAARVAEDPKGTGWFALALTGVLALAVSLLFGVRWVVQHRNVRGLRGDVITPDDVIALIDERKRRGQEAPAAPAPGALPADPPPLAQPEQPAPPAPSAAPGPAAPSAEPAPLAQPEQPAPPAPSAAPGPAAPSAEPAPPAQPAEPAPPEDEPSPVSPEDPIVPPAPQVPNQPLPPPTPEAPTSPAVPTPPKDESPPPSGK